jgi:trans-2-enoyl-CoA reductase
MLSDFAQLDEGDFLIQNGATSAVGQSVIQLANRRRLTTINLVRQRDRETVDYFNSLIDKGKGSCIVSTLETLKQDCQTNFARGENAPKLGLNCVGGEFSEAVAKQLQRQGTLVTYGGMSMKACSIPTPLLIFKDIRARGFWLSGWWYPQSAFEERKQMVDELCEAIREDSLSIKKVKVPMENAMEEAFANAAEAESAKVLLFN